MKENEEGKHTYLAALKNAAYWTEMSADALFEERTILAEIYGRIADDYRNIAKLIRLGEKTT
jgi:hypothetical protein